MFYKQNLEKWLNQDIKIISEEISEIIGEYNAYDFDIRNIPIWFWKEKKILNMKTCSLFIDESSFYWGLKKFVQQHRNLWERWNLLEKEINIKKKEKRAKAELERLKNVGDKIFELAKKKGVLSISDIHVKLYGLELNEDVEGLIKLLTIYINRKFGENLNIKKKNYRIGSIKEIKIELIKKHKNKCKICKKPFTKTDSIDIHHIDNNNQNDKFDNLIPLHTKCHRENHKILIGE